jgi:RNA polymerase sigma factor (TIGR02999 family)
VKEDYKSIRPTLNFVSATYMIPPPEGITQLLADMRAGNPDAINQLIPLVYDELRALAHQKLSHERSDHTLNTTGLVHEAYIRLVDQRRVEWQNRSHFFAIAAQAMRRILVNHAAKRQAAKRGGNIPMISIDTALEEALNVVTDERTEELLILDEAMNRLEQFNERGCRVVEYRFFGGLSHEEIAEVMGISTITVRRAWSSAKAWLRREMQIVYETAVP